MEPEYTYKATVLRVVDGDTLDLDIDLGLNVHVKERVRLARIDTPETYGVKKDSEEYQAGKLATEEVVLLTQNHKNITVTTQKDKKGKYGRYVVELFMESEGQWFNLNDTLVEKGLAEYKEY